jgi:glyoxylase-like metal-dependent hydrolase (beta-lactamase superfamily II)
LTSIGVRPEQITHVLITHTHDDHFAGVTVERGGARVARFPRARHLVGRRDWDDNPNRTQPGSALTLHLGTLERLGLLAVAETRARGIVEEEAHASTTGPGTLA